MPFTEDLSQFVDPAAFGRAATWNSTTVNGIFDNGFLPVDAGGEIRFETLTPQFICRTADVAGATHGQSVTIDGVAYLITGIHPDGTGFTTLMLRKP